MNGIRALLSRFDAIVSGADEPIGEQRTDLRDFVGEEVEAVEKHPHGYRMRFCSGRSFVVRLGATFDAAGNPVIETHFENPAEFQPRRSGHPAAASVAVHARGGGPFGDFQ